MEIIGADYSDLLEHWAVVETEQGARIQLGHLEQSARNREGKQVERGEYLATEGDSGKSSGHHLDLRLWEQGEQDRLTNTDRDAFYERLTRSFNAPYGDGGASQPCETRVTIVHESLDRIRVDGLEPGAAERFRHAVRGMTDVLGDMLTSVRQPQSYQRFG